MKHYHGTPIGGTRDEVARFVRGRHCLIPFNRPEDLPIVADIGCSMCFDCSSYSAWKSGEHVDDWSGYYKWCLKWCRHPRFEFAIIPDVIDGTEEQNNKLFVEWFNRCKITFDPKYGTDGGWVEGAAVWHLHESLDRLSYLMDHCRIVCLGSSGHYATVGTRGWHHRMSEAMSVLCDDAGRPRRKIHGLRMLDPDLVRRYPFSSADSTNVAQNKSQWSRFGQYTPPTQSQRCEVIASRIESTISPAIYVHEVQKEFVLKA